MARELAIVEAEIYPDVPNSFQTLVRNYAIYRLHISDHFKYHDASIRILSFDYLPSRCKTRVFKGEGFSSTKLHQSRARQFSRRAAGL
jgi:hypothetical protein